MVDYVKLNCISGSVASDDTAIKVQNASGFEVGEVIFFKKVTARFLKRVMKITSTSRQDLSEDTDFNGFYT